MKRNIPTVTVAVSVYNEQDNISNFLRSVLKQKTEGFKLSRIVVFSDGSTDNTIKKIKQLKSSLIQIVDSPDRIGKSSRLNQIYKTVNSDILVQSDADVIFSSKLTISHLIKPLLIDKKVGMCGGHPTPMKPKTFTERAVNSTFGMYSKLRRNLRNGSNVFSADGRLLAYRKALYKKIVVPEDMIANDAFTYFVCITNKFMYKYSPDAVVKFRSPQKLKDQIRQNTRFVAAPIRLKKIFMENLVEQEYFIPKRMRYTYMAQEFIKNPIGCAYIYAVNKYCKYRAFRTENKLNAKWEIAVTTKRI